MVWKKGESGNPKGQPRKPEVELMRQALEETNLEKKKSLWKHLAEQAYEDNTVLIALAKKFLPDKLEADVKGQVELSDEDKKMVKEFLNILETK